MRTSRQLLHRKGSHGSGQWALPGGKLDFAETLEACAARELQEETGVQVPAESFQRAWVTSTVFNETTHYVTVFLQAELPEVSSQRMPASKLVQKEVASAQKFLPWIVTLLPLNCTVSLKVS